MPYYSYFGGDCGHCGDSIGIQEVYGGRQKIYCSDKCRKAAYRARKEQQARLAMLRYNSELRDYWQENGIEGKVLAMLQDILIAHGKDAAKDATNVVLAALKAEKYVQKARTLLG